MARSSAPHRVDVQEFYQLLDRDGVTDDIHLFNEKLREWEDYYNFHRPHGGLGGQAPYERLIAKTRGGESTRAPVVPMRPYLMLTILITSSFSILSTTFMPFVTRPITAYLPFRFGLATLRMKNWLSADSGGRPVT